MTLCYKCNSVEVQEEFKRCPACQTSHETLAKQLDAKPRVKEKKIKEELFPIVEMKQGIKVTTWVDRETARINGMKLSK